MHGRPVIPSDRQAIAGEDIGVLLVEDDDGDARLVQDELTEWLPRAQIVRSRTLEQALSLLGTSIDCVLLDLGLPDALGVDAVVRLKARMPSIPLIVLTGLDDDTAGNAALQAGAQDYLVKGHVGGEQLVRSIRYSIGRRRAEETERELLLAEAQAREVNRLERGLAPKPLLEDSPVWVASCYHAGRSRGLLGGDFFDLVQSTRERLHVLVGDVCGHGPDEAAIGVSLRAAWRALVLAEDEPEIILRTLQEVFEHERHLPGLFVTLCMLEIDPIALSVSLVRAGHPRPVLIQGSTVSSLGGEEGGSAGIGFGHDHWRPQQVDLEAEWTILLYTDGIVDGRVGMGPERLGEEGLHRLIAEQIERHPDWREHPRKLLDSLISLAEELNGGPLNDDVAMLLVGMRG